MRQWWCKICHVVWLPTRSWYFTPTSVTLPNLSQKSTQHCYCVARVKVMGAERREAGAEAERERDILLSSECALLSCTVYCALHSTGGHSWTRGTGEWATESWPDQRPGAAIWAVSRQYLLLFAPPASAIVTQSVTKCDSVTSVTEDTKDASSNNIINLSRHNQKCSDSTNMNWYHNIL